MAKSSKTGTRAAFAVITSGILVALAASCSASRTPSELTESQGSAVTSCGAASVLHAVVASSNGTDSFASTPVYVPSSIDVNNVGSGGSGTTVTATLAFSGGVSCTYSGTYPSNWAPATFVSCSNSAIPGALIWTTSLTLSGTMSPFTIGGTTLDVQVGKSPDDNNACTIDTCPNGAPFHQGSPATDGMSCDSDNNVCNGISTCQAGVCTAGAPLVVEDNNGCTNDSCDPQLGALNVPNGNCAPQTTPAPYPGNGTLPSDFAGGAQFIATQNGASASYDSWRAAIVRGRVTDANGAGLGGVLVTVRGYPTYGTATTTSTGYYDIETNGGETYTLSFSKATYLPAIRTVKPRWLDFTVVNDVTLVQPVTAIAITPNSGAWQRATFPTSTDNDGARTPVVLVPPSTTIASGSAPSPWNLRVTEFTVGALGPSRMPADLPAQSAYTYAADFSIDGASDPLTFNQPVIVYLDNFTNNPLSLSATYQAVDRNIVPVGSLNSVTGKWDADPTLDPTGRVIQIKSITGGMADLSFDGSAIMSSGDYTSLGVTTGERTELAAQYPIGVLPKNVWRIPLKHFCPKDFNWPADTPNDAVAPPGKEPLASQPADNSCKISGSIIECENQVLGESLPIPHTPFSLMYRSVTQNGWHPVIKVQITDERTLPSSLARIETEITVAGVKHVYSTTDKTTKNQYVTWSWDRLDVYGRKVQGQATAQVKVAYVYPSQSSAASAFGAYGSGGNTGTRTLREQKVYRYSEIPIGAIDAQPLGLGGWLLDVQHVYEPRTGVAWWGFGDQRTPGKQGDLLTTFSPANTYDYMGQLSARAEGGFLIAQARTVIKYDGSGTPAPLGVAQGGSYSTDPPPANDDQTSFTTFHDAYTTGVAAGPDDTFYVSDGYGGMPFRVWKVGPASTSPSRKMTLVAGKRDSANYNNPACLSVTPSGSTATNNMFRPGPLALGKDGAVFFADLLPTTSACAGVGGRIIRVSPSGIAQVVAGNGDLTNPPAYPSMDCQHGLPVSSTSCAATSQPLGAMSNIVVADDGSIYFAEARPNVRPQVWRVTPDGLLSHVAGCLPGATCTGDGGPAQTLGLGSNAGTGTVVVAVKGSAVYVFDRMATTSKLVWLVDANGVARRVAGNAAGSFAADVPATSALLSGGSQSSAALAVGIDGTVVGTDATRFFQFKPFPDVLDPNVSGSKLVPIGDGAAIASFTSTGRLDKTYSAARGKTQYTFGYDGQGRLVTINDATATSHPTTTIEYVNATTVRIHPPFDTTTSGAGARTSTLTLSNGYLQSFAKPAPDGGHVDTVMGSAGLLTQLTDENAKVHTFQYSSDGLLLVDKNPLSQPTGTRLDRSATPDAWTVTVTSPAGRVASHTVDRGVVALDPQRIERRHHVDQASLVTDDDLYADGRSTTKYPAISGQTSSVTALASADPRYGFGAAFTPSYQVTNGTAQYTITNGRAFVPSTPTNAFTYTTQTDTFTYTASGATTMTVTQVVDTSTAKSTISTSLNRQLVETLDTFDRVVTSEVKGNVPGLGLPLNSINFRYDVAGHLDQVSQGSRLITGTFDNTTTGYLTSLNTPLGIVNYSGFDSLGRPHTITQPGGRVTGINYDSVGNVLSVTTPRGLLHTLTPNAVNELDTYAPPSGPSPSGNTLYGYDRDSLVTSINKLQTGVASYDRDSVGRYKTVTFPTLVGTTESQGYTYDEAGHVKTANSMNESITYTYDGDRVTKELYTATPSGPITYSVNKTYDSFGRLKQRKIIDEGNPSGPTTTGSEVNFTYDAEGQISQVAGNVGVPQSTYIITRPTGNPSSGLISGTTLGNISDLYEYDAYGALAHYKAWTGTTILYEVTYSRDSAGRVIDKVEKLTPALGSLSTCNAHYDYYGTGVTSANWLQTQSGASPTCPGAGSWTYDADGNRNTGSSAFDAQDRTQNDGSWTYGYDADGDVTSASWTTWPSYNYAYARDLHGALRRVTPSVDVGAPTINYDIDAFGRRLRNRQGSSYVQGYLWDGDRVVAMEKPPWGIVAVFAYVTKKNVPDYMLVPGNPWTAFRIISDELGSVRMVVNAAGNWSPEWHTYDAWGVPQGGAWSGGTQFGYQPFGFAGGLWDTTAGLYRFGARDYNPVSGRWWSKDPSRFGGGVNFYAYAFNDPVNLIDPWGRDPAGATAGTVVGCVGGAAVGADLGAGAGAGVAVVTSGGILLIPAAGGGAVMGGVAGCIVGGTAGAFVGDKVGDALAAPKTSCGRSKTVPKPRVKAEEATKERCKLDRFEPGGPPTCIYKCLDGTEFKVDGTTQGDTHCEEYEDRPAKP